MVIEASFHVKAHYNIYVATVYHFEMSNDVIITNNL